MSKKTLEGHVVVVEQKLDNGLTAHYAPLVMGEACKEMGVLSPENQLYFSCCLYFCKCAHHSIDVHQKQVTLEEETDITGNLRHLLESCMLAYGLDDINKLDNFFPLARSYAFRKTLAWNPQFQAWIDSAGRAYNEQTREEKAWDRPN